MTSTQIQTLLMEGQQKILALIQNGTELSIILDCLLRLVEKSSPGMIGTILVLEGNKLLHGAAPSMPEHYNKAIHGLVIGPEVGSCGTAAFTGRPCIIEDIANHANWAPFMGLAGPIGLASCWSTPILSYDKKVLGTFAIYYKEKKAPGLNDRKLIDFTTHLATLALEKNRDKFPKIA